MKGLTGEAVLNLTYRARNETFWLLIIAELANSPGALGLTKEKIPNKLNFSELLAYSTRNNISKLPKNPKCAVCKI